MLRCILGFSITFVIILLISVVFFGNYEMSVTITPIKSTQGWWHENLGARGGIHTVYTGGTIPPRVESVR